MNESLKHHVRLIVIDVSAKRSASKASTKTATTKSARGCAESPAALADAGPATIRRPLHESRRQPAVPVRLETKRAAITGASYLVGARCPSLESVAGSSPSDCAKDRHGHHKRGDRRRRHRLPPVPRRRPVRKGVAPRRRCRQPAETSWWTAKAAVDAVQEAGRPLTTRELRERMRVKARQQLKDAAIDYAVGEGALKVEDGPKNARLHVFVKALPEPGTGDDF